jgi:hypothetical protein
VKQAHIYTRCLVDVSQWALSNNVLHADWLEMQLRFYGDSARYVVASGKASTHISTKLMSNSLGKHVPIRDKEGKTLASVEEQLGRW